MYKKKTRVLVSFASHMGGIEGVGRSCEIACGFKSYCCHCETQVLLALRGDPPVATNNGRQRSIAMHREEDCVQLAQEREDIQQSCVRRRREYTIACL